MPDDKEDEAIIVDFAGNIYISYNIPKNLPLQSVSSKMESPGSTLPDDSFLDEANFSGKFLGYRTYTVCSVYMSLGALVFC